MKKRKLDGIKNGDGSAEKLEREKQSLAEFYAPALARLPGTLQIQPQIQNIIREYVEKNPHQFPSPDVEGGAEGGELPLQVRVHLLLGFCDTVENWRRPSRRDAITCASWLGVIVICSLSALAHTRSVASLPRLYR